MDTQSRPATEPERQLLVKLLSVQFPGRDEILEQVEAARVFTIDTVGSLRILVQPGSRIAAVTRRVPVEGNAADSDGIPISFLLHVIDGRAYELEVYKADGSTIARMPKPNELEVIA